MPIPPQLRTHSAIAMPRMHETVDLPHLLAPRSHAWTNARHPKENVRVPLTGPGTRLPCL